MDTVVKFSHYDVPLVRLVLAISCFALHFHCFLLLCHLSQHHVHNIVTQLEVNDFLSST